MKGYQKFLDAVEKAANKGIGSLGSQSDKLWDEISDLETKLRNKKDERNAIGRFLDKLHKIVAVIKE